MSALPQVSVPPLAPDQVHVWRVPLEVDARTLANLASLLSVDERQRADRLVFPELRRRYVVARATLRRLLAGYARRRGSDLQFIYGASGKPELADGGWHFNVSHSAEKALIAVATGGAVGIDLEMIRPLEYEAVGRGVLSAGAMVELLHAPASARAECFFRLWVRHEAQVKALGSGIGTRADVPVYPLEVGSDFRAALATAIQDVRIELLEG